MKVTRHGIPYVMISVMIPDELKAAAKLCDVNLTRAAIAGILLELQTAKQIKEIRASAESKYEGIRARVEYDSKYHPKTLFG